MTATFSYGGFDDETTLLYYAHGAAMTMTIWKGGAVCDVYEAGFSCLPRVLLFLNDAVRRSKNGIEWRDCRRSVCGGVRHSITRR